MTKEEKINQELEKISMDFAAKHPWRIQAADSLEEIRKRGNKKIDKKAIFAAAEEGRKIIEENWEYYSAFLPS